MDAQTVVVNVHNGDEMSVLDVGWAARASVAFDVSAMEAGLPYLLPISAAVWPPEELLESGMQAALRAAHTHMMYQRSPLGAGPLPGLALVGCCESTLRSVWRAVNLALLAARVREAQAWPFASACAARSQAQQRQVPAAEVVEGRLEQVEL